MTGQLGVCGVHSAGLDGSIRCSRVVFDVEIRLRGPFVVFEGLLKRHFGRAMRAVHADLEIFVGRRGPSTLASPSEA